MKKIFIIFIIIIGLCGGALWYLASAINPLVQSQIEQQGQTFTGQKVTVGHVDIKLSAGSGEIGQLTMANPAGYKEPNWLSLEKIKLDIDTNSFQEPYTIETIEIIAPKAFVEFNADGSSNIQEIFNVIKQNLPESTNETQAPAEPSPQDPRIKVTKLLVTGVSLTMDLSALGNKVHSETLPAVDLGNIGGEHGIPASQLGGEITKRLTQSIWQGVQDKQKSKIFDEIKDKAKEKLGGLIEKLGL